MTTVKEQKIFYELFCQLGDLPEIPKESSVVIIPKNVPINTLLEVLAQYREKKGISHLEAKDFLNNDISYCVSNPQKETMAGTMKEILEKTVGTRRATAKELICCALFDGDITGLIPCLGDIKGEFVPMLSIGDRILLNSVSLEQGFGQVTIISYDDISL